MDTLVNPTIIKLVPVDISLIKLSNKSDTRFSKIDLPKIGTKILDVPKLNSPKVYCLSWHINCQIPSLYDLVVLSAWLTILTKYSLLTSNNESIIFRYVISPVCPLSDGTVVWIWPIVSPPLFSCWLSTLVTDGCESIKSWKYSLSNFFQLSSVALDLSS